ncbi:MAG: HAMP domain-containing sensor histidine kinase [Chloroflexota bacterium]
MSQEPSFLPHESRAFDLLSSRVGYAFINAEHVIESAQGIIQSLSYTPDVSVINQPLTDAFVEFFGYEESLDEMLAGNVPFIEIAEVNRPTFDDDVDYFDFGIYPADNKNPGEGLILLVENTTSQGKLMQRLIQQRNELRLAQSDLANANRELHKVNELKSVFLSMAAHDLRSPLSIISTYADIMLTHKDKQPFEQSYVFSRILEQSMWLNSLIDDILNLNMVEQGKLKVNLEKTDIRMPLRSIVDQFQPIFKNRNIDIRLEEPEEAVWVSADANRIKQIALNLVGNSAKFLGDSGDIRLTVATDSATNEAIIGFGDNGPGIPPAQQEELFQLFYRTPGASKFAGTGLGLYIVKTLSELHGGTIEVESEEGHGTTFFLRLPIMTSD